MGDCAICGVNLAQQHQPWAHLAAWPRPLLHFPSDDELCMKCREAVQ